MTLRASTRGFVPWRARRRERASVQLARTPRRRSNEQERCSSEFSALVDAQVADERQDVSVSW